MPYARPISTPTPAPPHSSADPSETTSAELLARAADGDADAFAQLYDETSPQVYGLVLRVVRDPGLAEQVTREVFLQAWHQAAHYDRSSCSALAWLTTSAHRRAVDTVRRSEAVPAATAATAVLPGPAPSAPAAELTRAALAALVPAQREAIELAYFGGYTHAEVGLMLDPPTDSAAALLRDGLQQLGLMLGVAAPVARSAPPTSAADGSGQSPTASIPRLTINGSGLPTMSESLPS